MAEYPVVSSRYLDDLHTYNGVIIDRAEICYEKDVTYVGFNYSNYTSQAQDPLSVYGSEI